jgi:hypothetical protein
MSTTLKQRLGPRSAPNREILVEGLDRVKLAWTVITRWAKVLLILLHPDAEGQP